MRSVIFKNNFRICEKGYILNNTIRKTGRVRLTVLGLSVGIGIFTFDNKNNQGNEKKLEANENSKIAEVEKIEEIDKEIEDLHNQETITQENWLKEGELLLEKEELEKDVDREGYYKKHFIEDLEDGISMLKHVKEHEMPLYPERKEAYEERIDRFTKLFNKYEKKSEDCTNYEELYYQFGDEMRCLSIELRKKYSR